MTSDRSAGPSLALRAALALALGAGFYVLALAMAALLLWIPLVEYRLVHRVHYAVVAACLIGAGVVLWSAIPRRIRWKAPGPKLDRESQPRLFEMLEGIACGIGQRMPRDVHLVPAVNAFVAEVGGFLGIGRRRVMGIGLPLLRGLTVGELRSVLVHEFGHFHGGDTRLGPLVYGVRAIVLRTANALAAERARWSHGLIGGLLTIVRLPFIAYAHLFLRVSHAVSRRQEYAADALAGRTVGVAATSSALRALPGLSIAWATYLQTGVLPILDAGMRPPLAEGFRRYLDAPAIAPLVAAADREAAESSKSNPLDTHPCLRDRLAMLAADSEFNAVVRAPNASDAAPAASLLDGVDALEAALVAKLTRAKRVDPMPRVEWADVAAKVVIPGWKATTTRASAALGYRTPLGLPRKAVEWVQLGHGALQDPDAPSARAEAAAIEAVCAALSLALLHRGWILVLEPGLPLALRKDGLSLEPYIAIRQLRNGKTTPDAWEARCRALGIDDLPLGAGVAGV